MEAEVRSRLEIADSVLTLVRPLRFAHVSYQGEAPAHVKCPNMFTRKEQMLAMQQRVRNRHETVNKRFKQWGCIRERFRHGTEKHSACFRAVAVLTQLAIEFGEQLFSVEEYSDP
jgi:hypothetical protein